ncbi:MAG: mandelate racemase/muconate lactonizing enzyme family protein [Gammaproteobacteria bacterium]|nr:mandelate racemase/muconate lactonizing enzyme family protein [Gammaproteobacteria bacterium]
MTSPIEPEMLNMRDGLLVTALEVIPIRVSSRTVWRVIRLHTNKGLTGLGEALLGQQLGTDELDALFRFAKDRSPFDLVGFRRRAWPAATQGGLRHATALSAIEQALWDLAGKALDAPVYTLLGGALRDEVALYANINRMTTDRVPDGFAASARLAGEAGFTSFKAAPFDGFPAPGAGADAIAQATDLGIDCLIALREALGPAAAVKVDCHSHFDRDSAVEVARRLEPVNLDWYEEPIPPTDVATTRAINDNITQRMAGGELMFGVAGFAPLCRAKAVDVIMPDVMHCGGILEGRHIAALAAVEDVAVSPHNACGPVATVAGLHLAAGIANFESLELQWGEVRWRGEVIDPPEIIENGMLRVPNGPGLGIELNDALVSKHSGS